MKEGIHNLIGKIIKDIKTDEVEFITFECTDGEVYKMYHSQDCCESVLIDEIHGDLKELVGSLVLFAEETTDSKDIDYGDTCTWTFYKISTVKHSLTIRWYGTSNGYYSEAVDFIQIS
jgi:hypothetical protein